MVFSAIESLGYKPETDEDGYVFLRYQMKNIFVSIGDDDNDHYLSVILPQFYEIGEDEDALVLAACNKIARDVRMVKAYIDHSFQNVSASCEFYYTDEESMKQGIEQSLKILGMMRGVFRNAKKELGE